MIVSAKSLGAQASSLLHKSLGAQASSLLRSIRNSFVVVVTAFFASAIIFTIAPQPVPCQESQSENQSVSQENDTNQTPDRGFTGGYSRLEAGAPSEQDLTYFFAFLSEDPQPLHGGLVELFRDKPVFKDLIAAHDRTERRFRPMLQWRRWADRHQKFFPAIFFIAFTSILSWSLLPGCMQSAAEESRKSYWRCFGTGAAMAAVTMLLTRCVFQTELGWPLGILIAGLSQAAMLAGLSVAVFNLGHSVLLISHVNKIPAVSKNPAAFRIAELLMGSLLAASLLQIPPLGMIPQIGTRFLAFFALLGCGAIFRVWRQRRKSS